MPLTAPISVKLILDDTFITVTNTYIYTYSVRQCGFMGYTSFVRTPQTSETWQGTGPEKLESDNLFESVFRTTRNLAVFGFVNHDKPVTELKTLILKTIIRIVNGKDEDPLSHVSNNLTSLRNIALMKDIIVLRKHIISINDVHARI